MVVPLCSGGSAVPVMEVAPAAVPTAPPAIVSLCSGESGILEAPLKMVAHF